MNRKHYFIILLLACSTSCNLKEKMDEMEKVNSELKSSFNHNNIVTSFGWSTEDGNDNVQVSFYQYDLNSQTVSELEKLANKVTYRLLAGYPKYKQLDYIEIRFTKEEQGKNNESFVNFRKTKDEF